MVFSEGWIVGTQVAVDLIGTDDHEWDVPSPGCFKEAVGSDDVCLDKGCTAENGTVDVAFCGQMENRIHAFCCLFDRGIIGDITDNEFHGPVTEVGFKVARVAGVGEQIKDTHGPGRALSAQKVNQVTADKSGSACNQESHSTLHSPVSHTSPIAH